MLDTKGESCDVCINLLILPTVPEHHGRSRLDPQQCNLGGVISGVQGYGSKR